MNRAMVYGPHARLSLPQGRFAFFGVTSSQSLKSFNLHGHTAPSTREAKPSRVSVYAQEESERHGVSVDEVFEYTRRPGAVDARHAVMRRLRADGFKTTQIARWMGRDHSTVIYALGKAA